MNCDPSSPTARSGEAVSALKTDSFFREALGSEFVDYYTHIKTAEIERF